MSLSTPKGRGAVAVAVMLVLSACSLIVNKDKDQCSVDADCGPAGAGVCIDGVCMASSTVDASHEGAVPEDGPNPGNDSGCTPKVPVTQSDFLNETCTNASCVPFDNCARVGLCPGVDGGDGSLPALIAPPDGGF